jgi:hypothetical protein
LEVEVCVSIEGGDFVDGPKAMKVNEICQSQGGSQPLGSARQRIDANPIELQVGLAIGDEANGMQKRTGIFDTIDAGNVQQAPGRSPGTLDGGVKEAGIYPQGDPMWGMAGGRQGCPGIVAAGGCGPGHLEGEPGPKPTSPIPPTAIASVGQGYKFSAAQTDNHW